MPCVEIRIDPEAAWEPQRGLLGLPRELRYIIYELVLVEPPKCERRHKALCDYCPRNTKSFERPLFDHFLGCPCHPERICGCGLRSTGLLAVNRQLHRETAPIFWARNVFSFGLAETFAEDVGESLREEYRKMLQHIIILGVHWEAHQLVWPGICYRQYEQVGSKEMWQVLETCSGLKTLEMGPEKVCCPEWEDIDDEDDYDDSEESHNFSSTLAALREKLPLLEEFAFARVLVYDGNRETSPRTRHWYLAPKIEKRHLIYVKARMVVDLSKMVTAVNAMDAARAFRTNYLVHIKFAVETKLLGIAESVFSTSGSSDLAIMYSFCGGLDESNTIHELELRDGTSVQVQLLGLPITKRTQLRQIKERWKEDARRKLAGKPSTRQEKLVAVIQERKDMKKAAEEEKDRQTRERLIEARRQRTEDVDKEGTRDKRRAKRKEQVEVGKTRRVNEVVKKMERKRVPRPK